MQRHFADCYQQHVGSWNADSSARSQLQSRGFLRGCRSQARFPEKLTSAGLPTAGRSTGRVNSLEISPDAHPSQVSEGGMLLLLLCSIFCSLFPTKAAGQSRRK